MNPGGFTTHPWPKSFKFGGFNVTQCSALPEGVALILKEPLDEVIDEAIFRHRLHAANVARFEGNDAEANRIIHEITCASRESVKP